MNASCHGAAIPRQFRLPHLVALTKSKVFVADAKSEKFSLVSYLHIAALETISNGHSKRRRAR